MLKCKVVRIFFLLIFLVSIPFHLPARYEIKKPFGEIQEESGSKKESSFFENEGIFEEDTSLLFEKDEEEAAYAAPTFPDNETNYNPGGQTNPTLSLAGSFKCLFISGFLYFLYILFTTGKKMNPPVQEKQNQKNCAG